jgi:hypothetical protein
VLIETTDNNYLQKGEQTMKKIAVLAAVAMACAVPTALLAADHGSMNMDHGSMNMEHGGHKADVAHEEIVDGVKATFRVMGMDEHLKAMKMEMPKGVKDTHHIAVEFKDAKSGKALTEGEVKAKVQAPDKAEQVKDLMGMQGHFGGDFDLSKKGKYGVMVKFVLKDGKVRSTKFWYTVK